MNLFVEHEGTMIRKAFSMSSSAAESASISLSIRLSPTGELTPILWKENYTGRRVKLMGPLGMNTADKMTSDHVFLFGFGVGAGVVKSLADSIARRPTLESLMIVTGNRSVDEILHKDYFDELAENNSKVRVSYVVSDKEQTSFPVGYIQDHVLDYAYNDADVYMCGQTVACVALEAAIKATNPRNCRFFIEDFH